MGLDCARSREALRLTSLDVDFWNDMAMAFLLLRLGLGLGPLVLYGIKNQFLEGNFQAGESLMSLNLIAI